MNFIHHLIIPLSRLGGLMMILLKLEKKFKASLVGLIIVKNLFLKDNKRTIKLNANILHSVLIILYLFFIALLNLDLEKGNVILYSNLLFFCSSRKDF